MGEVADVVQRLNNHLWMKLKIVGQSKDFIISPNLWRGWEAPDKDFGDNAHNSLRAVLERSRDPSTYDSSLAQDRVALPGTVDQIVQVDRELVRSFSWGAAQLWRVCHVISAAIGVLASLLAGPHLL